MGQMRHPKKARGPRLSTGNGKDADRRGAYNPTVTAAFARKRWPSRMYRRATAMLLCLVWRMMSRSSAPAITADVASPARRLWPA